MYYGLKKIVNSVAAVIGHCKTICIHRHWALYYACKLGIPVQGICHDLSKFSPVEFWESVRYYQGGKSSPIVAAKKDKGYSTAWNHHVRVNKHHYEHWRDYGKTTKVPFKYATEIVADYLAAGKTYHGKEFTFQDELIWWKAKLEAGEFRTMHPDTRGFVTFMLEGLAKKGAGFFREFRSEKQELEVLYEFSKLK